MFCIMFGVSPKKHQINNIYVDRKYLYWFKILPLAYGQKETRTVSLTYVKVDEFLSDKPGKCNGMTETGRSKD